MHFSLYITHMLVSQQHNNIIFFSQAKIRPKLKQQKNNKKTKKQTLKRFFWFRFKKCLFFCVFSVFSLFFWSWIILKNKHLVFFFFWWLPPTMDLEKTKTPGVGCCFFIQNQKKTQAAKQKKKYLVSLNHKVSSKFCFFVSVYFFLFRLGSGVRGVAKKKKKDTGPTHMAWGPDLSFFCLLFFAVVFSVSDGGDPTQPALCFSSAVLLTQCTPNRKEQTHLMSGLHLSPFF